MTESVQVFEGDGIDPDKPLIDWPKIEEFAKLNLVKRTLGFQPLKTNWTSEAMADLNQHLP